MKLTQTEKKLMAAMSEMEIIDCHEHLPPERQRTDAAQDVFTLLSHYTRHDLFSAGMDRSSVAGPSADVSSTSLYEELFNTDLPLAKRWQTVKPYWQAIRHGSYARAARLTARIVYGVEDISDETYELLSERIAAENTPGIYRRMLCERCNIRVALTQCQRTDVDLPLVPLMPIWTLSELVRREQLEELAGYAGTTESPGALEGYLELAAAVLSRWIAEGTVGIKMRAGDYAQPPPDTAAAVFRRVANGEELPPNSDDAKALAAFLTHRLVDMAADLDLVVAVHAGIWGDFRELDSKHMLAFAPVHPAVNFDLYHLGMPSVRDTIVVAKNLPNVYLNLCWTHIISQAQARSGIDEMLDQVPTNKILAFGGDYARPVEKVVGHLHMAREDYAWVFGRRIDRGLMDLAEAAAILRTWFWDNPLQLYSRLSVAD